jgi:hypothetical protein
MITESGAINTIYIVGKTVNTRGVNKKARSRIPIIGDGGKSTPG